MPDLLWAVIVQTQGGYFGGWSTPSKILPLASLEAVVQIQLHFIQGNEKLKGTRGIVNLIQKLPKPVPFGGNLTIKAAKIETL